MSISTDPVWRVDPIALMIATNPATPHALTPVPIDNVFSEVNAASLSDRLKAMLGRPELLPVSWTPR